MTNKFFKPIIVLDFDGVIHSYKSGWKGASVIDDDVNPGAIEFILKARKTYQVAILSSRSHQWGGKRAMKKWLKQKLKEWIERKSDNYHTHTDWINASKLAEFNPGMEPWGIEMNEWADGVIHSIKWPWFKPPAKLTIDDRAMQFCGTFPEIDWVDNFKPF